MDKARQAVAKARLEAAKRWPHARMMATAIPVKAAPGMGTMAVNGDWVLLYDPKFVLSLTGDTLAGVVQHELLHLMLDHIDRGERFLDTADWQTWNIACDCVVNGILMDEGVTLPDGAIYCGQYGLEKGKSAEEYFEELRRHARCSSSLQQQMQDTATGQKAAQEATERQAMEGKGKPKGLDKTAKRQVAARTEEAAEEEVKKAQESGKRTPGYEAASRLRQAHRDAARGPKVTNRLQQFIAKATNAASTGIPRRSYRYASRRHQGGGDVLRPGRKVANIDVCVCVDTSGSMNKDALGLAMGAIDECLKNVKTREGLRVVTGDTQIEFDKRVRKLSDVKLIGSGGTDMAALMIGAIKKKTPDVIVLVTDGGTPWPAHPLPCPVVCVMTTRRQAPSWIQTLNA